MSKNELLDAIHDALDRHPAVQRDSNLTIRIDEDVIVLEGTVPDIATKRLVPLLANEAGGGHGVADRLTVRTDAARDDGDIAADAERALSKDREFASYSVSSDINETDESSETSIGVRAARGVIQLTGQVQSICHRRLAEVLAWWTPGCVDVDNRLYVSPPERDSDDEVTKAVHLVLERDPRADLARIQIRTLDRVVILTGMLSDKAHALAAASDAWYVPGVHGVDNRIRVVEQAPLDACADEASRESFPASDPPSITPVVGVGGTDPKDEKKR